MKYRSRLWFALLLLASGILATRPASATEPAFMDVSTSPYLEAIETLRDMQLISGRSAERYAPDDPVTRAEMAVLLLRVAGLSSAPDSGGASLSFADVPADHWAAAEIGQASRRGWIRGAEGRFHPGDPVTHEEALTMVLRAANQTYDLIGPWPDDYIDRAVRVGLLEDFPFERGARLIRGEAAQMLFNWILRVPDRKTGLTLNQTAFRVPASLAISPDSRYLDATAVTVEVTVTDPAGRPLEVPIQLSAEGGSFDGSSLRVQSGAQTVTVTAAVGALSLTHTYTVLAGLHVTAPTSLTWPGSELALSATLEDGRPAPNLVWSTNGGAAVSPEGVFVAEEPGMYTVSARSEGLTASVRLLVARDLLLEPTDAVGIAGTPLHLTLLGVVGTESGTVPGGEWELKGFPSTAVYPSTGEVLSHVPGTGTVTVRVGERSASARVTMTGPPASLSAKFSRERLAADPTESSTLTIQVLDDRGRVVPVDGQVISLESYGLPADLAATSLSTVRGVASLPIHAGATPGVVRLRVRSGDLPVSRATLAVGPPVFTSIQLQIIPKHFYILNNQRLLISAMTVDELGHPIAAPEALDLTVLCRFSPPLGDGALVTAERFHIAKGSFGVVRQFMPVTYTPVVLAYTAWLARIAEPDRPLSNSVTIIAVPYSDSPTSLQAVPVFSMVPADGSFRVRVMGVAVDGAGAPAFEEMKEVVFTITGPGGTSEVKVPTVGWQTDFELPAQSIPGTYTVTEKSGAIKPFDLEYYAPVP